MYVKVKTGRTTSTDYILLNTQRNYKKKNNNNRCTKHFYILVNLFWNKYLSENTIRTWQYLID